MPRADGLTYHNSSTHGQTDNYYRHHMHNLAADGNRSDCVIPVKLSDYVQIRQTIQCLQ